VFIIKENIHVKANLDDKVAKANLKIVMRISKY